jgi:hypothetical protein
MSIRKLTTLGGLALAVVALSPASAPAKAGGTDRPVKGSASGTVSIKQGLLVTADVTGVSSHFGNYTGHFEGQVRQIIPGNPVTVVGDGTFTLVVANGDQLTGTFTFTGPPPSLTPHEVTTALTITGGTGRFADATGTVTTPLLAIPSLEPPPAGTLVEETVEGPTTGQISY